MIEYNICSRVRNNKKRFNVNVGDKFYEFKVIDSNFYKTNASNHIHVKCICSCGDITYQRLDHLRKGINKACFKCGIYQNGKNYRDLNDMSSLMFRNIKSRASSRNISFNLTMNYLQELFEKQSRKCSLTNTIISIKSNKENEGNASLDRIDPNKGYIIGNVQWINTRINIMKGNLSQIDFINVCRLITENNKHLEDNFEPNVLKDLLFFNKKLSTRVQRLTVEESNQ